MPLVKLVHFVKRCTRGRIRVFKYKGKWCPCTVVPSKHLDYWEPISHVFFSRVKDSFSNSLNKLQYKQLNLSSLHIKKPIGLMSANFKEIAWAQGGQAKGFSACSYRMIPSPREWGKGLKKNGSVSLKYLLFQKEWAKSISDSFS